MAETNGAGLAETTTGVAPEVSAPSKDLLIAHEQQRREQMLNAAWSQVGQLTIQMEAVKKQIDEIGAQYRAVQQATGIPELPQR